MKVSDYRVRSSEDFDIDKFKTELDLGLSEEDYSIELLKYLKKLKNEQFKLYANSNNSVLIVLQGMDAAGKDGIIKHVLSNLNTQGTEVHSFKAPSKLELSHDFLWRHYIVLPPKGKIGIFNRSHYENVLVTKVHPSIILNENLPGVKELSDVNDDFWSDRYKQISNFEKHLAKNGTVIIKIFLNLSKDEQSIRLLSRINEKKKNWKFSKGDFEERKYWDDYREAFSDAIENTSKKYAPWYLVPADNKLYARLLVAKIIHKELQKLDLKVPEVSEQQMKDLEEYREVLSKKD
ncbi:MAG: polyphosphate kinase 2 family protein [Flavobacteriales bacterium]|nr:polyphosphate kinase 2 family protein [Flavobacteriales bacterium]